MNIIYMKHFGDSLDGIFKLLEVWPPSAPLLFQVFFE